MSSPQSARRPHPRRDLSLSSNGLILLLVLILSLGASLRFYRLGAQSLWNDEGNSARIAERPLALIVEGAAGDIHPPGYYLLLRAWRGIFGQTEFALRSLSVVAGVALMVVTYVSGRYLFDRTTGLVATSFSALSPLAIYYAQEARMYALVAALAAASLLLAFRTIAKLGRRGGGELGHIPLLDLALYVLVNVAGVYTHYTFGFLILSHNLFFGLRWLAQPVSGKVNWEGVRAWLLAQVAVVLLYLPWVPTALGALGWSPAGGDYEIGVALLDMARVLAVGVTLPLQDATIAIVATAALLLVSLWSLVRAGRADTDAGPAGQRWATAGLFIYLVVPVILFLALDLYKPAWLKFLIILLPPLHLLMAHGTSVLASAVARARSRREAGRRVVRLLVGGTVVGLTALLLYPSLHNLYFDPVYARDDYRQLAADIREMWRPGEAIVLNAPNQWEVFTYYYPDCDVYPAPYRPDPGEAAAFLESLAEQYHRLYVLYWGDAESDPTKRIESWLAAHAYKASDRWYGNVRLATYGLAPPPRVADDAGEVMFGDCIQLRGFSVTGESFSPGEIIPVALFWEALDTVGRSYKVTVQMLNGEGGLIGQIDTVPRDGLAPTTLWQPGEPLVDLYGVRVPESTTGGRYSLLVAVYDAVNGERLPVKRSGQVSGDAFLLGDVLIEPER